MTGDDLITYVTEGCDVLEARAYVRKAPKAAREAAADLLYLDIEGMSPCTAAVAIVRKARA